MRGPLIRFDDSAKRLGYHPQHLRKLIKAGKIKPPIRLHPDGRPYYTDELLEEILAGEDA